MELRRTEHWELKPLTNAEYQLDTLYSHIYVFNVKPNSSFKWVLTNIEEHGDFVPYIWLSDDIFGRPKPWGVNLHTTLIKYPKEYQLQDRSLPPVTDPNKPVFWSLIPNRTYFLMIVNVQGINTKYQIVFTEIKNG